MNINWPLYYHAIAIKNVSKNKVDKQESGPNHFHLGDTQNQSSFKAINQLMNDHDQSKLALQVQGMQDMNIENCSPSSIRTNHNGVELC